jgi:glycerol-3-phosphate dehydrogenase
VYDVGVIGGGVVGAAVALALARRGADTVLLEAADALATAASGTNSGILHTGFDSVPGELETRLILRSAQLRDPVLAALAVPVRRCGAVLRGAGDASVARARENGVEAIARGRDLEIPGEAITDPVAYTEALAMAATACGATIRTGFRVTAVSDHELVGGEDTVRCRVAVNCAGLYADEVAHLFGDESFSIYPRKGEFLVYDGIALDHILLPVPTERTKGVLVFPTVDGKVVAGPTAVDQEDKEDWSVRPEAVDEVRRAASALLPELADAEPVAAYAGLRPAGRGVNYLIRQASETLVNVAAIRSTGLSAALGIGEHVATLVLGAREESPMPEIASPHPDEPWWQRSARRR